MGPPLDVLDQDQSSTQPDLKENLYSMLELKRPTNQINLVGERNICKSPLCSFGGCGTFAQISWLLLSRNYVRRVVSMNCNVSGPTSKHNFSTIKWMFRTRTTALVQVNIYGMVVLQFRSCLWASSGC